MNVPVHGMQMFFCFVFYYYHNSRFYICFVINNYIKLFGFNCLNMWHAQDDMSHMYHLLAERALCILDANANTKTSLHPTLSPLSLSTSLVHYWWFRLLSVLWLLWGSHRHHSNRWVFWTTGKWKKEKKKDVFPVMSLFVSHPSHPSVRLACCLCVSMLCLRAHQYTSNWEHELYDNILIRMFLQKYRPHVIEDWAVIQMSWPGYAYSDYDFTVRQWR